MNHEAYERYEKGLAHALRAPDPVAALEELARDPQLPPELARGLAAADPRGVRISALIVARLRFERLLQGSRSVGEWFERDGRGFTEAFRRYHREVPSRAESPLDEARQFEAWRADHAE